MPDRASTSWLAQRPIAHRGLHDGNRAVCENTISAALAAIERGYAIECDVVLSADGVAMVHHDLTLDRLTATSGAVIERSSAELSRIVINGTADRIPTLAEFLGVIAGRVGLVIELKGHDPADARLVAAVANALDGYAGPAALMSFDPWLVRAFGRDGGGWPFGLTAEGLSQAAMESHFAMLAHGIGFASYNVGELPNPFVRFMRERLACPVITWTVRTPADVAATRTHADQMTFEGFLP